MTHPAQRSESENPPAFPALFQTNRNDNGMTLRDWFAGQALNGCIANALKIVELGGGNKIKDAGVMVATEAYAYADAMLAARKATREG